MVYPGVNCLFRFILTVCMTILLQSIKSSIFLIKIDKGKVKHDKISENLLKKDHSILKRLYLAQAVNKNTFVDLH